MSRNLNTDRTRYRHKLLSSASAVALLGSVYATGEVLAADNDADHPQVWIELGAQFERDTGVGSVFAAPFVSANDWSAMHLTSPTDAQQRPPYSFGGEGSIAFQPKNANWEFSASVRYGRSHEVKHSHDQLYGFRIPYYLCPNHCLGGNGYASPVGNYEDTHASNSQSYTILDFRAGKDVGLGMFGIEGSSMISAGVRFAQFGSRATVDHHDNVKFGVFNAASALPPPKYFPATYHNAYVLSGHSERSFRGVGPSISWKASTPVAGNSQTMEIAFDWEVNAALLFGRQKAKITHRTTAEYSVAKYHNQHSTGLTTLYNHTGAPSRERSITVPNVGGTAGISFRYSNAKLSLGYRADFFFGAMDGGVDIYKGYDRNFYGPFAAISIGLGG